MVFIGLVAEGEDKKPETRAFIDYFQIPWLNGYGAMETLMALGVDRFPTTVVIGGDGRTVWNSGMAGTLEQALDKALASSKR